MLLLLLAMENAAKIAMAIALCDGNNNDSDDDDDDDDEVSMLGDLARLPAFVGAAVTDNAVVGPMMIIVYLKVER